MANTIKEALNAVNQKLTIFCGSQAYVGNQGYVGIGLSGTWVGTMSFFGSFDGVNFIPVSVQPFPSGTGVITTTANGSFFTPALNYVAFQVQVTTLTSGTVSVVLSASGDSSYQDAFLAPSSIYISQISGANAANVVTVAAQANRAWKLRTLVVSFSGTATTGLVTVSDGPSSTIWQVDLPFTAGFNDVPLPIDNATPGTPMKGLVGTPGNSMVITVAAAGGTVKTNLNAELHAS